MLELVPTRGHNDSSCPIERSLCFTPLNRESEVEEFG